MWSRRARCRAVRTLIFVGLTFVLVSVQGVGYSQSNIPDGTFVQDAGGAVWLVLEGRRVRVPIYPATVDEVAALPMGGQWLVPQDGTIMLGSRPSWVDVEREGSVYAGHGRTTSFEGLTLTVLRVSRSWLPPYGMTRPKPGTEYLTIEVQIRNGSDQAQRYSAADFNVDGEDGTRSARTLGRSPDLSLGTLSPGALALGWLTFEVPIGREVVQLVWFARRDHALAIPL